ncbi:hypothetical protein [Rickettsiella endosymbiont of Dermanyssus gallinae]|uniref:hypothetical protein n=1 Tax=Rickettsiella endosymbiont of Dermanyssus gallinae TaxID=2856608 RepID=UPI001C533C17|nr:hypothetical protein [Rickettsiella endosymbiont of Dermanyssus gallinae]
MTANNNRLAEKINLVDQATEVFQVLANEAACKNDGIQFEKDFSRTSEIELRFNKKLRLHYKASDASESESGLEAANKQSAFTSLLKGQRPELESVIKQELHQDGAFFTGRNVLGNFLFPRVAIRGAEPFHHFIIDVINKDEVTVKEMVTYKSLLLYPIETANPGFLTEARKKSLENYRSSPKVEAKLTTEELNGVPKLVLPEEKPFLLSIQYKLHYCEETKTYKLAVPSEKDITLTVPTTLAKGLVSGGKWTIGDKISEFISKFTAIVKKLVIGKVSEHAVTEQCRQDQSKPSEESQSSSFAQRMRA